MNLAIHRIAPGNFPPGNYKAGLLHKIRQHTRFKGQRAVVLFVEHVYNAQILNWICHSADGYLKCLNIHKPIT